MANPQEAELRRLIAAGLAQVNQRNGGRHLSAIARRLDVDRTTVTRWSKAASTASVDHCRSLARNYPEAFDESTLLELHAMAALGPTPGWSGAGPGAIPDFTMGAAVHWESKELHRAITQVLLSDTVPPQNRICSMAAFHLDRRGIDAVTLDPDLDPETRQEIMAWREALMRRAAEGWKIRTVVSSSNLARMETIRGMVDGLDGPSVEIRGYPLSTPMTMAVVIIANSHVVLAYDHRRWERPDAAIMLSSRPIVDWANQYFDQVFDDAPFRLRSVDGPRWDEFEELRRTAIGGLPG